MARLEIRLLGSFEVRLDGRVVTNFESNKVRALLAYLAGEASRPQFRESLAELFWPDWPQGAAMSNLRYALADLRKCIGDRDAQPPFLITSRQTIQINMESSVQIDTLAFDQAVARAEKGMPGGLQQAVVCYDRPYLDGFSLAENSAFTEWVLSKRAYYNQQMLKLLRTLVEVSKGSGDYETGLKHARRALEIEPWQEEAHQQIMQLLALSGQRSAALAQYQECKRLLKKELGVAPGEETRRLVEQIVDGGQAGESVKAEKQDGPSSEDLEQIALESLRCSRHNLPVELTSFWGREKEIREIRDCFVADSTRMVTLRGAGGIGKSRLALRVAAGLVEVFKDGVCWVGLAPVSDADLVPRVVARSLELAETTDRSPRDALRNYLRSKHLLIVLDNCEHLIDACALLAQFLLMGCPKICILATSRERLGVEGERVIRVPSLTMPDENTALEWGTLSQFESVELFVARAQTVAPGFTLSQENAQAVSAICRRLDGIPLAIELAVARMRILTPAQIEQRLTDVFHLLTGGERTALPRHQSLRAAIDWSYQLLPLGEQRLLQELSIFSAGWTFEAAEAVGAGDQVLDELQQLVEKSLVIAKPEEKLRFTMLETIRQYALEKLIMSGAEALVRSRHLAYFLALAERVEPELRGPTQIEWLNFLERELPNLRAAMEWGLKSDLEAELRLAGALLWFWHIHNRKVEGLHWLDRGLDRLDCSHVSPGVRAKAFAAAGCQRTMRWEFSLAESRLSESLCIYRDLGQAGKVGAAFVLSWLGCLEGYRRRPEQGLAYLEEAQALYQEVNDPGNYNECLLFVTYNLGCGNPYIPRVGALLEEYLKLVLEVGDPDGIGTAYFHLSHLAGGVLDLDRAKYLLGESLMRYQQVGNTEMVRAYFVEIGYYNLWEGNYQTAIEYAQKSMQIASEMTDPAPVIASLLFLAEIYLINSQHELAERCLADALSYAEEVGLISKWGAYIHFYYGLLAFLQEDYSKWEHEMSKLGDIHEMGPFFEEMPGRIYWTKGDTSEAIPFFCGVLKQSLESKRWSDTGMSLDGFARSIACNRPEEAVRLFGAAEKMNRYLQNLLFPPERVMRDKVLGELKAVLGEERLTQLWAEGQGLLFEEAVERALQIAVE